MRDLTLKTLIWILYAKRPLRTLELQHALATDNAYETGGALNTDPVDVILEACGNLIEEENSVMRPVHYSVQEFLTKPQSEVNLGPLQKDLLDIRVVHETLASVCIKYLQLGRLTASVSNNQVK